MARVEVTPEFWVSPYVRVKRQSALDPPSARGKRMTVAVRRISSLGNGLKGAGMEANELLRVQNRVTSERDPENGFGLPIRQRGSSRGHGLAQGSSVSPSDASRRTHIKFFSTRVDTRRS